MRHSFIVVAALTLTPLSVSAQDQQIGQTRLTPSDISALPKLSAGVGTSGLSAIRTTVLWGDPNTATPYTIALEVPPNTRIAAHSHRDFRSAVVVSGIWFFGYGIRADEGSAKALMPGSFYTEPADGPHFAFTGAEPAVVYITGFGPSDTRYVEAEH